jgi:1,4-dihydroxy-2-naphthoate polyprenyltransferase
MIFLIWGPILVTGVYLVLAKGVWSINTWNVVLASIPFGLSVLSINLGKHIDKLSEDKKKGVGTLPVRLGEKFARYLNMAVFILMYGVILYLVFGSRFFTPVLLIVFLASRRAFIALAVLTKIRPQEPPEKWPGWPTWFSAFAFYHNRLFGNLLVLGILVDTLLRLFVSGFWPLRLI